MAYQKNGILKRKVEESNNIDCQNTNLKLINIQGLTKTKSIEVEKLMNDHTILFFNRNTIQNRYNNLELQL